MRAVANCHTLASCAQRSCACEEGDSEACRADQRVDAHAVDRVESPRDRIPLRSERTMLGRRTASLLYRRGPQERCPARRAGARSGDPRARHATGRWRAPEPGTQGKTTVSGAMAGFESRPPPTSSTGPSRSSDRAWCMVSSFRSAKTSLSRSRSSPALRISGAVPWRSGRRCVWRTP